MIYLNFRNLRNEDYIALSKNAIDALEKFDTTELALDAKVSPLKAANDLITGPKYTNRAFEVTAVYSETREECMRIYSAIRFYANAFSVISEENEREAASKISEIVSYYGRNVRKASYSGFVSKIGDFIAEIEESESNTAAIATLKAERWFDLLKSHYTKLYELDLQRLEESMARPQVAPEELRFAVRTALQDLYKYVEAMALVSDNAAYSELEQALSTLAERYNNFVKIRQGHTDEPTAAENENPTHDVELEVVVPEPEMSSV